MSEWSERYQAYLRSPQWQEKRAAVLTRSRGVCEACREAPAQEVHHTTYDHVFDEPLWELRAVCDACHDAISEADGIEVESCRAPNRTERHVTEPKKPRDWQSRGADICVSAHQAGCDRALVYACPGSGKTYGAIHVAKSLIHRCGKTSEIVVITPSIAIRTQWISTARELGVELEEISDGAALRQSNLNNIMGQPHGFILGYKQAINLKHSLRTFCETNHPIVILDEVHHTAGHRADRDGNAWGSAVEYACQHASFKLPTTGTPFREGNEPIAFVSYNEAGEATATVRYPYGDAIRDGVCRQVEFEFFDGYVRWESGGRQITADFSRKLSQKLQRERLEAALKTEGEFPVTMLTAAHQKLTDIRAGKGADAHAAGLVVAIDIDHAEQLSELLQEITGERPVIVHSKLDEAQDLIERFRVGASKWLIGISMISEGVDIPRLRVGVYATRVRTALYFHQFVGRFTRVQESPAERSFVFLPRDSEVEAIAIEIEKERYHAIGQEPPERRRRARTGTGKNAGIEVIDSESELVASATGGVSFPIDYQRRHAGLIRKVRSESPVFSSWSDAAILHVCVATGAIERPAKETNGGAAAQTH